MKRYFITNDWDRKSYLCQEEDTDFGTFWSHFKETRNERVRFTYFGACFYGMLIKIFSPSIRFNIEEVTKIRKGKA